jgi:hypothetical protein
MKNEVHGIIRRKSKGSPLIQGFNRLALKALKAKIKAHAGVESLRTGEAWLSGTVCRKETGLLLHSSLRVSFSKGFGRGLVDATAQR